MKKTFSANEISTLERTAPAAKSFAPQPWISESTAMLVIHGIGNQNPLETLDQLGRGIIEAYWTELGYSKSDFTITHKVAVKKNSGGRDWFDNYLRVSKNGSDKYIDLYEYYWANLTENKVSLADIQRWISDVVHQAKKFYKENVTMEANAAETRFTKKSSKLDPLTHKPKVNFKGWRYKITLILVSLVIPLFNLILKFPQWISKKNIPGVSFVAGLISSWFENTLSTQFANVIGDIVVYNTADEKCSLYEIRKNILAGAVDAVQYLIEPPDGGERAYGKVLLAGHSLGSQIAYDAINRINHLVNFSQIKGVNEYGKLKDKQGNLTTMDVSELLCGLVTFGSPLDKIAFFLREHVERQNILMLQIINDYHSFRQRDWYNIDELQQEIRVETTIKKYFEKILWRNYFDRRDYVSGSLDFYNEVINIDCDFAKKTLQKKENGKVKKLTSRFFSFTHSWYWSDPVMFKDIITNFLK